jgi:hypothetical protein
MLALSDNSALKADIKQIGGRTIAPRIRISRPVEESERCSGSKPGIS